MDHCPNLDGCRLFPLFTLAGTLRVWKDNYCGGRYTDCARYRRALLAIKVPDNLLPNGTLLRIEARR